MPNLDPSCNLAGATFDFPIDDAPGVVVSSYGFQLIQEDLEEINGRVYLVLNEESGDFGPSVYNIVVPYQAFIDEGQLYSVRSRVEPFDTALYLPENVRALGKKVLIVQGIRTSDTGTILLAHVPFSVVCQRAVAASLDPIIVPANYGPG